MTQFNVKPVVKAMVERIEGTSDSSLVADATHGGYRTPQLFPIGPAKDLMRQNGDGNRRDSLNWWCFR
jgi:hypothetical protein